VKVHVKLLYAGLRRGLWPLTAVVMAFAIFSAPVIEVASGFVGSVTVAVRSSVTNPVVRRADLEGDRNAEVGGVAGGDESRSR
jgi:hypothetical protein